MYSTYGIIETTILIHCKLTSHCQIFRVRDTRIPYSETVRIAVVAPLVFCRSVEEPVKVHLFSGIVFVDIDSIPFDLVSRVFHAVNPPCQWLLCYAN